MCLIWKTIVCACGKYGIWKHFNRKYRKKIFICGWKPNNSLENDKFMKAISTSYLSTQEKKTQPFYCKLWKDVKMNWKMYMIKIYRYLFGRHYEINERTTKLIFVDMCIHSNILWIVGKSRFIELLKKHIWINKSIHIFKNLTYVFF